MFKVCRHKTMQFWWISLIWVVMLTISHGGILQKNTKRNVYIMERFWMLRTLAIRNEDVRGQLQKSGHAINCAVNWASGSYSLAVYFAGTDQQIISLADRANCGDIRKYAIGFKCPVKVNEHVQFSMEFHNLIRIPTGNYTVILKIMNQNNLLFACANATFYISEGMTNFRHFLKL
ncbi:hypothetical protein KUTeg_019365 [Tegillarca granosa]|uniref:MD-2-related lipid-recognition domain-containing protein n=1 Tax=Tegillarca granosa TaxID=220873 RepID=A0ABQ9EEF4_TEGGR|nr:hypothetical protein KUTeg_019365 [Tegillarca granosa]